MARMSENFYLRKCFLEREQVPTQTTMIKKMSPPLARVYFKSMNYNLKVLAGFEPPMKGGGSDWYIPPEELLAGRVVMKPVKHEYLQKLGFEGIANFGEMLVESYHKQMEEEKKQVLLDNDINWKQTIEVSVVQTWNEAAKAAAKKNTENIQQAFREFTALYTTSINRIETLLFDAAVKEIQDMQNRALKKMQDKYKKLLKKQATMLYDRYTKKFGGEKAKQKANFVKLVEEARTVMNSHIHDIKLEKHVVIEKIRQLLEGMNLACQVYVALKEREECQKEMDLSTHEQKKVVKALQQAIEMKDFEIRLAQEKERKREEFITIWKKKVCEVVKKFQMFAEYCLYNLPEHADFFIDMEKLMMLQLSEAMENPSVPSLFVKDESEFHDPVPKPHLFYLCCDKGYKPDVDEKLCPKPATSSASQLPVVIINKRCIYAACDNFELFTDKITDFIHGRRGEDNDFTDDHIYEHDFPIKMTSSQQIEELKLESSLQQVLQSEMPNLHNVPTECCICRIPYCFCSPLHASKMSLNVQDEPKGTSSFHSVRSGAKIQTRTVELVHEREPKWDSYMEYVKPQKCKCGKMAKKHLSENLPAYMRNTSMFEESELPNYEKCTVATLKKLVRKAQGKRPSPPPPAKVESKTREVGTQYTDQEFDYLCNCFSDDELKLLFQTLARTVSQTKTFKVVGDNVSPEFMNRRVSSFAMDCAKSLRNLLHNDQNLEEIFKVPDCNRYK